MARSANESESDALEEEDNLIYPSSYPSLEFRDNNSRESNGDDSLIFVEECSEIASFIEASWLVLKCKMAMANLERVT